MFSVQAAKLILFVISLISVRYFPLRDEGSPWKNRRNVELFDVDEARHLHVKTSSINKYTYCAVTVRTGFLLSCENLSTRSLFVFVNRSRRSCPSVCKAEGLQEVMKASVYDYIK